jgi:hypothetical protein
MMLINLDIGVYYIRYCTKYKQELNVKQIGFMSLALQAGMDPTEAYPHESGIFPVSYVAIIGEWSYLMEVYNPFLFIFYFLEFRFIFRISSHQTERKNTKKPNYLFSIFSGGIFLKFAVSSLPYFIHKFQDNG